MNYFVYSLTQSQSSSEYYLYSYARVTKALNLQTEAHAFLYTANRLADVNEKRHNE